jgi:lysophospholipase L1-like esterase
MKNSILMKFAVIAFLAFNSMGIVFAKAVLPTCKKWHTNPGPKVAIVGDSIAVGIGGALLQQSGIAPEFAPGMKFLTQSQGGFAVNAIGGHSSPQILDQLSKHVGVKNADMAIISVGTNDFVNSANNKYYTPGRITQNLQRIRTEINAKERVWVLPYDPKARELVASVAKEREDRIIDLAKFRQSDRYHPKDYAAIANSLAPLLSQLNQSYDVDSCGELSPMHSRAQASPEMW